MSNKIIIGLVVGTRPEAIKMAPVIQRLRLFSKRFSNIKTVVYLSGQHRKLLDDALILFGIVPDFDLAVMTENQQLAEISAQMISGFDKLFLKTRPTMVLVHGDTSTAYAASMAAFYRKIPIGHIEAGLRSGIPNSPFPEEFNRRAIDSLSTYFFASTGEAVTNLIREGVYEKNVHLTGNTVIDSLMYVIEKRKNESEKKIISIWNNFHKVVKHQKIILVTSHRRENISGVGLIHTCNALIELVKINPNIAIVFPMHPNPNVSEIVNKMLLNQERIHLLPALDYDAFSFLMNASTIVVTDSGGVQEEAPALKKPVFVLRENCERPEVIKTGGGVLVGTCKVKIIFSITSVLNDPEELKKMANSGSPYGDGNASMRIVRLLLEKIGKFPTELSI